MPVCLSENELLAYLDGQVSSEEAARQQEHIDGCPACFALFASLGGADMDKSLPFIATGFSPSSVPMDPPSPSSLSVGQSLGNYLILRRIGAGGFGVVFEAVHQQIKHRAAIKVLHPHLSRNKEFASRFLNEARAANTVQHPGIVRIFEMGQLPDGAAYLVMEYLDGESLRARFERTGKGLGSDMLALCRQTVEILAAAHDKGIVHRDLKPDNIMIIPDPHVAGGERVKILDFGVAKISLVDSSGPAVQTRTGAILGTPLYMSPEQCRGSSKIDGKSDVYTLGVMLYELATGQLPFQGLSPGELMAMHQRDEPVSPRVLAPDLPGKLVVLIERMLAKDPADRPAMGEVTDQFAQAGRGLVPRIRSLPGSSHPNRPWHWAVALLIAATALAIWRGHDWLSLGRWTGRPADAMTDMALIPGGTFTMGSSTADIDAAYKWCTRLAGDPCVSDHYQREQPVRQVKLSPFYLDRFEVTNEHFAGWLNRQPGLVVQDGRLVRDGKVLLVDLYPSYGQAGIAHSATGFRVLRGHGHRPVTQVAWDAALAYCKAQGKHLPTEAQWEYAARGAQGTRFPWGDEEPECNGAVFARVRGRACAELNFGPQDVGSAFMDRSPQGVFDLAGNVAEWVMDRFEERYPSCGPDCVDPLVDAVPASSGTEFRVIRGGDWYVSAALCRAAGRGRWQRDHTAGNIGFRCASSAVR